MYFQIVNDALTDKDYSKSIKELKSETKKLEHDKRRKLGDLDAVIGAKTAQIKELDKRVDEVEKRLKTANTSLETTQSRLLELQQEVERLENYSDALDAGLKAGLELKKLNEQVADLCEQLGLHQPLQRTKEIEERRTSLTEQIKKTKPIVDSQKSLRPKAQRKIKPSEWDR